MQFESMIFGMIRSCMVELFLSGAMLAQGTPGPKVRIVLPQAVDSKMVYVRYGLRQPGGTYPSHVARMPAGVSSFEIPAPTDRFKALIWAPGCKIKEFDIPIENSDVELQFACDPLKRVTLRGRVKYVDIIGPMTLSVDYSGMIACLWADACKKGCIVSCSGLDVSRVATAEVAPDGSFEIELPDFNNDPIVSGSSRELDFWLSGVKGMPFLVPESSPGSTFKVAASYPDEVIFVPLDFKDSLPQSH
jgi:hypothetical protein